MDHQWKPQSFAECVELIAQNTGSNPVQYPAIIALSCISDDKNPCFIEKHTKSPEYEKFQQLNLTQCIEGIEEKFPQQNFDLIQSRLALHNKNVIFTTKQINANPGLQKQLDSRDNSPSKDQLRRQPSLSMLQKTLTYHQTTKDAEQIALAQQQISRAILLDNTKSYRQEQQRAETRQKEFNELFKKHIETIKEWNEQEEPENPGLAGSAVSRIAENIEFFEKLSSYKDFQTLDLSKLLAVCGKFNYYTNTSKDPISNLQKIQDALAPHNTSINLSGKQQPAIIENPIDNSMLEEQDQAESSFAKASPFAKASADITTDKPLETITEIPEETQLNDDLLPETDQAESSYLVDKNQATDHKEQTDSQQIDLPEQETQSGNSTPREQFPVPSQDNSGFIAGSDPEEPQVQQPTPSTVETSQAKKTNELEEDTLGTPQERQQSEDQQPQQLTQSDNSTPQEPSAIPTQENSKLIADDQKTPETLQPYPSSKLQENSTTISQEPKPEPQEKAFTTPFYKKPLFVGLSLCTLFALYCYKCCDKEILTNFLNNPQSALTYLRAFLSQTAT